MEVRLSVHKLSERGGSRDRRKEGCKEEGRDGEGGRERETEEDRMIKKANQFMLFRHKIHTHYLLLLIFTNTHIIYNRSHA